jgi:peptidyl-prolyl cis-trans isomerase A (cyclophilin A)
MRILFTAIVCAAFAFAQTPAKTGAPKSGAAKTGASKSGTKTGAAGASRLLTPKALKATAPAEYKVKFETTKGSFVVDVHRDWAPIAADRFYNMVRNNYFDGVRFFRAVKGFMVQFGIHPRPDVNKAWMNANIMDEPTKHGNTRGTLTFARTGAPNSRSTQLFINTANNAFLDNQGFAAFGEVVEGMDVVDQFYTGYGEATTNDQGTIMEKGEPYLAQKWPLTDKIVTARIESAPAAPAAAAPKTGAPKSSAPKKSAAPAK